jgi:hypothetical protein
VKGQPPSRMLGLETAKALGLTIAAPLRLRATQLIE